MGKQLYSKNTHRLYKFNVIAAAASTGELWFSVNNGFNDSNTFWYFLLSLCLKL